MTDWDYFVKYLDYDFNKGVLGVNGWDGGTRRPMIEYDFKEMRTLILDFDGRAWESQQPHGDFPLYQLPRGKNANRERIPSMFLSLRTVDGDIYAVGRNRLLWKKTGFKEWVQISDPGKHPNMYKDIRRTIDFDCGFKDADGFNENDIYAGGEREKIYGTMTESDGSALICRPTIP